MLAKIGYENMEFADNGRIAFEKVRDNQYDIVLMDIMVIE